MLRLYEVKEFDKIICNIDYENNIKYKYINEKDFHILESFIYNFRENKKNEDISKFFSIDYKPKIGTIISVRNYVGLIQIRNEVQIQILPKIVLSNDRDEDVEQIKEVFLKMLRGIRNFPYKVFNNALLDTSYMSFYEVFVTMYLQEVLQLVKRGISSFYIEQEGNLTVCKGKLLINKNIKKNFIHKERFFVSYKEFHLNRPENKIIKTTLVQLQRISLSMKNLKDIKRLLMIFEKVELSINYQEDLSKIIIDRNMKNYERVIEWSKIFLMNKSFSIFSGTNEAKALLFPTEYVYESYVAQQIKKVMGLEWEISIQDKSCYLFMNPQCFELRPDIVMYKDNRIVILDTKWKKLNIRKKHYGISQSDMYQMYAYSKKYKTSEIWMLYPLSENIRNDEFIEFNSGDNTIVKVHFIDLINIEENLEVLKNRLENDEKRKLIDKVF